MDLLNLFSGLLLPWIGGTLWLAFADNRFNHRQQPNRFRQAGYGFFLGYAIVFMAIMISSKLSGHANWHAVMVFLFLFAVSGFIAVWRYRIPTIKSPGSEPVHVSKPMRIFVAAMLMLMMIHLLFIAVEIITQPAYPWDAWLAWVYRAKVWFSSGTLTAIVSPAEWATATTSDIYTIDAWRYPVFASVIPYWAALSLGQWSETLINLPVMFAGLAIGMALYGQCRENGINVLASLVVCYLLFSIPLFGTHLALAGYADIWMAGFTGLGFVALMQGQIRRNESYPLWQQILPGLLMIMFSVYVKNEGTVWLLSALAMLALISCRTRVLLLILIAAIGLGLLCFALGITYLDLPLTGRLGVFDNHLSIPFVGTFRIEVHDIRYVYWDNFLRMGSWNLLWVLVAGCVLLGLRSPNVSSGYRARRVALSFILVFVVTQVFIFGFTNQGQWADTYTAINRLPLHFLPALLFAIVLIADASLEHKKPANGATETQRGDT